MTSPNDSGIIRRDALKLTGALLTLPLLISAASARETKNIAHIASAGRNQPFDLGWHFYRGVVDGLTANDGAWRTIDLPHDWSIEDLPQQAAPDTIGPFTKAAIGGVSTGFTEGGEGWYRKRFRIDPKVRDNHVELLFEGVAVTSEIWINGHQIGGQTNPYVPFALDVTQHINWAGDNIIAIKVLNLGRNSRWYAGSGIYRPVTIDIAPPSARIARWGVAAWTRRIGSDLAEIDVTISLAATHADAKLQTTLIDPSGKPVATAVMTASNETRQTLIVRQPQLWSPEAPNLYRLRTELVLGTKVLDRTEQNFGIRIVTVSAKDGLAINGKTVAMRGGCVHHDNGLLGACAYGDADDRRVRLLKARGFNAIRSAHNPSAESFREACDRHGMLLIEEAFDAWHVSKLPDDYGQHFATHWQEAVTAMVLAARNNPSVIMWSIGNEIPDRSTSEGVEWSWKLANQVKRVDPTRPVTAGLNQWIGHPMIADEATARPGHSKEVGNASTLFLDIAGYNYRLPYIEAEHKLYPERIVFAAESFPKDSYDYWDLAQRAPYMLGEFVWTAMDYLGEAGIGIPTSGIGPSPQWPPTGWPQINAFCGDIDLIGQQKPQSRYRDVVWGLSKIEIAVQRPLPKGHSEWMMAWGWSDELPSWTWPGHLGTAMTIRVFSIGDDVRLLLNGEEVGRQKLTRENKLRAEFSVPYAPGNLEAIAYKQGRELARKRIETAGPAATIRLYPERSSLKAARQALNYVSIEICDAQGQIVPDAAHKVSLEIDGPAELLAFGSANPVATGSFKAASAMTWHGRALAVLRSKGGAGTVQISATSADLTGGSARVLAQG